MEWRTKKEGGEEDTGKRKGYGEEGKRYEALR